MEHQQDQVPLVLSYLLAQPRNNLMLKKWQFVVTHTICQTEIHALLDSQVRNKLSVKML